MRCNKSISDSISALQEHQVHGQNPEGSVPSMSVFPEFGFGRRAVNSFDSSALGRTSSHQTETHPPHLSSSSPTSWTDYLATSLTYTFSPLSAVWSGKTGLGGLVWAVTESSCEFIFQPFSVDCKNLRHSVFGECMANMAILYSPFYAISCFLFFMK